MKAAVWYGYKDIRVENVEEPTVELGFVKVKVVWTGICGTDRMEGRSQELLKDKSLSVAYLG